jgi:Flp pilus assembly protein TadB
MALLLWIFLSSQVLFLGAELSQVYATMYGSHRSKPEKRTPRQIDAAGHPQLTAQIVEGAEPPADSPETPSATAAELRPAQGSDASEPQRLAIAAGAGVLAGALMTVAMALGGLVAAVLRMMRMVRRQA